MIPTGMSAAGGSAVAFTTATLSEIGRWRPCHLRGVALVFGFAAWRHQIDQARMHAVSTHRVWSPVPEHAISQSPVHRS
jgi:hypothetical protein